MRKIPKKTTAQVECPHLQLHRSCVIDGNSGIPAGLLVGNGGNYQLLFARPDIFATENTALFWPPNPTYTPRKTNMSFF